PSRASPPRPGSTIGLFIMSSKRPGSATGSTGVAATGGRAGAAGGVVDWAEAASGADDDAPAVDSDAGAGPAEEADDGAPPAASTAGDGLLAVEDGAGS